MIRWVFLVVVLAVAVSWPGIARAGYTQSEALAQCNAGGTGLPGGQTGSQWHCVDVPTGSTGGYWQGVWCDPRQNPCTQHPDDINQRWPYDPNGCSAGAVLPAGTLTLYSSTTGATCRQSDMCEVALKVGGDDSGSLVLTGQKCSASAGPFDPGKPPSETPNADGSTTWCESNTGTCVTGKPAPPAPPPSSGDTGDNPGNGSTDSSSTTTSGATSSTTTTNTSSTTTSTTNTTTTGGGTSGGSGDSTSVGTTTGTTTGTQTSTTDTPASSSSTSSKCTTGVCDVGQADGIMGGMYEPSGETPASVYANFRASVSSSALGTAVTGFFNTSGINGSCPTWHIPGNIYWGVDGFSFDFFCSSGMLALLALAGLLVLAVGAFSAFRIAIY